MVVLTACRISLPPKNQFEHLQTVPNIEPAITKNLKQHSVFSAGNWPEKQWWLNFKSPELDALITESLTFNPTLQDIRSRIMVAKQEAVVTGSILFPLVYFDATDIQQYLSKNGLYRALNPNIPLNTTLLDLSLSFNYEFDFWGQNRNLLSEAIGKAKDDLHASLASLESTKSSYQKILALVQGTSISEHPLVQAAAQEVRDAWVQLYRCKVYAPVEGMVAQRTIQVGMTLSPNDSLMSVIPLEQIWVNANFKETQLKKSVSVNP